MVRLKALWASCTCHILQCRTERFSQGPEELSIVRSAQGEIMQKSVTCLRKAQALTDCNDAPQGVYIAASMACLCHGVCLVQYEKLIWRARVACHWEANCSSSESFDFVPDHRDASLIAGVKFHHTGLHQLWPANIVRKRENRTV